MPQLFSLDAYFGSNTRLQGFSGIGMSPSAFLTLPALMPTVTKPHSQSTRYLLSGSSEAICARMPLSRLPQLVSRLLSSGRSRPPSICCLAKWAPGTTMS